MGRANVDEQVYQDPKFRRLCKLLAWPHPDFVLGAMTRLWIFAGNKVSADNPRGLVDAEDAEDATDHPGLLDACLRSGMARMEEGLVYFAGLEERCANLANRDKAKGGKSRAAAAARDERGRMLPSKLDQHEPAGTPAESQQAGSAVQQAGVRIQQAGPAVQPSAHLRSAPLFSSEEDLVGLPPDEPPLLKLVEPKPERRRSAETERATSEARSWVTWFNARFTREFELSKVLVENVRKLLRDGYTQQDLRAVAVHRRELWGRDEKMAAYLVPTTLLRPGNFARYVVEAREWLAKEDGDAA